MACLELEGRCLQMGRTGTNVLVLMITLPP